MVEREQRSVGAVGRSFLAGSLILLASACSTDSPAGPSGAPLPTASASISVAAGDAQTASAGETTPTQPSVRVADAGGAAVAGISVQFQVVSGGGTVEHPTATTDASGVASPGRWTLGPVAGTQELRATAQGVGSVSFFATAAPSEPSAIEILRGDHQTAVVGSAVGVAPTVVARDPHGNPVPGVVVTFSVTAGGGAVASAQATTDAGGEAAAGSWTLGTAAGTNRLRAEADGLTPVTFEATAVDAGSVAFSMVDGDGQTALVGTAVATAPRVRLIDAEGQPMSGVSVQFTVEAGGGAVTGGTRTTDAAGEAAVGSWTLGTAPGVNRLKAAVADAPPVEFTATAAAGPAASVGATAGNGQSASIGSAVAVAPTVRVLDPYGNPVASQSVTFAVASGSGSVTGASQSTNANGEATVGSWTLGATAGPNTLTATVAGTGIAGNPVTFSATATVTPAAVVITAGQAQSATVASTLPTDPEVRVTDGTGSPVQGVSVTFAVTGGGGSLTGATQTTDADGRASVGSWTLGSTAGANAMTATVTGAGIAGNPIAFTATGTAGPAAQIAITAGNGQSATVGSTVSVDPQVRVTDAHGNGVSGVAVTFAVLTGGGSVSGGSQTTNGSGHATVGAWTLGAAAGSNTLSATASGGGISGNPVTFSATGTAAGGGSGYDIEIRYNPGSTPTGSQMSAFNAAASQWESVIAADLPDTPVSRPAGTCTSPNPINETIDDLVIFVTIEAIDGPGGTLASAGPCLLRSGSKLSVAGQMRFDTADIGNIDASGLLDDVVMHEMGHVIGVGTIWSTKGLLADPSLSGGTDPHFTGSLATNAFDAVGGSSYAGAKVPVENTGGAGTADGHWRESVFGSELMTGWINPGSNPMSQVTVQSLADMGYTVSASGADSYHLSMVPLRRSRTTEPLVLLGDVWHVDIEILSPSGRVVGLIPR